MNSKIYTVYSLTLFLKLRLSLYLVITHVN